MKISHTIRAFLAICSIALLTGPASAVLVVMTGVTNGQVTASGYFSYSNSASGTVGFNDLTAFQLRTSVGSYSLDQVRSPQTWSYFGYNSTANQLTPSSGNICSVTQPTFSCLSRPYLMVSMSADEQGSFSGFTLDPADGPNPITVRNQDGFDEQWTGYDSFTLTAFQDVTVTPGDTVVTMAGVQNGAVTAAGYLSFDAGKTGVQGFSDLSGFGLKAIGYSYTLADVRSPQIWSYLAYDASAQQLLPSGDGAVCPPNYPVYSCLGGDYLIASASSDESGYYSGFTLDAENPYVPVTERNLIGYDETWTNFNSFAVNQFDGVPEPGSWAMFIGGFLIVGTALRRGRTAGFALRPTA